MIKVKGMDFKTVVLSDIGDRVYYGQEKDFSDQQYRSSPLLKKAIEDGRLSLLATTQETNPQFTPPAISPSAPLPEKPSEVVVADACAPSSETLLNAITILTKQVNAIQEREDLRASEKAPQAPDEGLLKVLNDLSNKVASIQESLTDKENISKAVSDQLGRVEESVKSITLTASGPGIKYTGKTVTSTSTKEEQYVPSSFQVEDSANHIKLETKAVGIGGSLNNSLSKLRELGSKQ